MLKDSQTHCPSKCSKFNTARHIFSQAQLFKNIISKSVRLLGTTANQGFKPWCTLLKFQRNKFNIYFAFHFKRVERNAKCVILCRTTSTRKLLKICGLRKSASFIPHLILIAKTGLKKRHFFTWYPRRKEYGKVGEGNYNMFFIGACMTG